MIVCVVALIYAMKSTSSRAAKYVLFAIGARLILSALPGYTFKSSPIGLSWNALGTIAIFGLGLLAVRKRPLLDKALLPVYPLALVIIVSGLYNEVPVNLFNTLIKIGYFTILMLAIIDASEDIGGDNLLRKMLIPCAIPFAFQLGTIVLNIPKAAEADGSASYIGGYQHEAAFSVILSIGLLVAAIQTKMKSRYIFLLFIIGTVGIILANYRTTILSLLPLMGATFMILGSQHIKQNQRLLISGSMAILCLAAIMIAYVASGDRFQDLGLIFTDWETLTKRPEYYDDASRRIMSGRAYIWSSYIYAYLDSSQIHHLIGFGPDQWARKFIVYAHNQLVCYLYDLGIAGVIATIFLWGTMFAAALQCKTGPTIRLIAAHVGFFILCMATQPMWMIEGLIFYAIVCGFTMYHLKGSKSVTASRRNLNQPLLPQAYPLNQSAHPHTMNRNHP